MEKTIKSTAINYGLYLGIILIILTGIGYAIKLDLFIEVWFGVIFLAATIIFCIISTLKSKKALGGYISFKDAFSAFFVTLLVGALINTAISIVIFNWIDPDAATELQEKLITSQIERLEHYNIPSAKIDKAIEEMEANGNQFAPFSLLQHMVWQIAGYSIVGLIVAAIVKKKRPEAK